MLFNRPETFTNRSEIKFLFDIVLQKFLELQLSSDLEKL